MGNSRPPRHLDIATVGENPSEDRIISPDVRFETAQRVPVIGVLRRVHLALFALTFASLALFVAWYVRQERFIYFWDYVGYHNLYIELGTRFELSPLVALRFVFHSVRGSDYNSLPTLLLMPFRFAFGPSRLAYILAVTVTLVFPAIVLFSALVSSLSRRSATESTFDEVGLALLSVLSFSLLPRLWAPVLLGSVDAGGLIIIFIILMLYFRADLVDHSFVSLAAMALLFSLLVLYRRWYAYWVAGFFGAVIVCEGLRCAWDPQRRALCKVIAKNVLLLGSVSFLAFFLVATPIAWKMMTTDYRDIYSAYRSQQPFVHNLEVLYDHFGLLTLLSAGLGIVLSAWNDKRRATVTFLCVQFAITYALFIRTQDFGIQHFYWPLATIALFLVFFAHDAFRWFRTKPGKAAFLLVFLAGSLATFAISFLPGAAGLLRPLRAALPHAEQYPKVRTDLKEMQALLNTLSDISKDSESPIYILSSSFSLNSSIAREACFRLATPHRELAQKIALTSDVDKRDGFPAQFLRARYVVLTIPFGYHLAPQDQRVIGVLAEQIVRGQGIGTSYDKLNFEYPLEDGSSAFIYRKDRPLDQAAVKKLSDTFIEFYPNNREKFEISTELIREVSVR